MKEPKVLTLERLCVSTQWTHLNTHTANIFKLNICDNSLTVTVGPVTNASPGERSP